MLPASASGAGRWARTQDEIRAFVHDRCWSPRLQAYTRCAGSEELDAAVLLAARGSCLADEPRRLSSTADAIRRELGAGGPLLHRYTGAGDEEGAFLACSFWAAEALARCGRVEEGAAMLDELVALANDVGLLSEEIDPGSGELLGNMPQALTHLALINAADVTARRGRAGSRSASARRDRAGRACRGCCCGGAPRSCR
jgi:GH15 family glucan-1,4-alpha-glucosidase